MLIKPAFKFAALLSPLLLLPAISASGASSAPGPAADRLLQAAESAPASAPKPGAPQAAAAEFSGTADIADRCFPPAAAEEIIYQSDFHWNYSAQEMTARFKEMYSSPKRLDKRAYWDKAADSLVLPPGYSGPPVKISLPFVQAVSRHIERALELGYAETVFFPDMGHSHLLIPSALWEAKYANYEVGDYSRMYEDMFGDPAVHIFYHTAEQLKTLENNQPIEEPHLLFRRANRNIAGPTKPDAELTVYQNPESAANTVGDVPGYRWWGAGFNLSAQKDGCFPYQYKGETFYFDISLHDLPMKPGDGGGWD
ncbi:MAG: hypothetical protein COX65_07335 [Elusimicrobia bacterium CG_4_10_14_0_2_um_filter_56_8]|nr:MAG: hypothetical protein AUJ51_04680 [Elusimicrobia bacterium CG1_02_56_21]PJA13363.1 MAG: hypothetical protein COX65_07335 [Elusimicrobia bacterium CG_4_10_14_0_2_um_filter_56_8]